MSVRVVYAVDEEFAMPLAVSLRSLVDNAANPDELAVTIVTTGLRDETVSLILKSCEEFDPDIVTDPNPAPPGIGHWHPTASVRLRIPSLIGGQAPLIYLDADTVVLSDLRELHDTPLRGCPLAAIRDPSHQPMAPERLAVLGIAENAPYFNASVRVIDPVAWREQDVATRVIACVRRHADRASLSEEEAMNMVLEGSWQPLQPGWNIYHMLVGMAAVARRLGLDCPISTEYVDAGRRPRIVHFAGADKPWLAGAAGAPFGSLFYQYLDRTAWSGWRPERKA